MVRMESLPLGGMRAKDVLVLGLHEIVAGKLVALIDRHAARDLFDAPAHPFHRRPRLEPDQGCRAGHGRQVRTLNRLLDGFEGKRATSKWAQMNRCSQDTANRDIRDLIDRGILVRGPAGGRSASCELPIARV